MSTINIPTYTGIIGNLQVLGTLTTSGSITSPTGPTGIIGPTGYTGPSLAGPTGSLGPTGLGGPTGPTGSASAGLGKAEYTNLGTQSIGNSTVPVIFPTLGYNTFGSNLTISGTNNTTFTNASGAVMYVLVNYKIFFQGVPNAGLGSGYVQVNGSSDLYGYVISTNNTGSSSSLLKLNNTDNFSVIGFCSSTVTTSQNSVFCSYVQIYQLL